MPRTLKERPTKEIVSLVRTYFCSGCNIPALASNAQESKDCDKIYKGLSTMFDILCSKFCVHHRQSSACQAPSTDNNRAETRHGTDVKEDARVGSKNGSKRVKEPVLVVGLELLLVLLLQAKGDLHWDNSCLLPFDPVRQGDGYFRGRKKSEKSCVVRRTFSRYMRRHRLLVDVINHDLFRYALLATRTLIDGELIFRRLSLTM